MRSAPAPLPTFAALLMAVMSFAASAKAQVIEIGEDGTSTTYIGPTQFLSETSTSAPKLTSVSPVAHSQDRYEHAAARAGIDVRLLRAVAWTESRGRSGAVSAKGALGIMQLMPGTALELGVDPLDPEANLHGGAKYLAQQIARFRSVPLALAAYNAGPGAVLRWGGIPPYAETQSYVAKILHRYQGPPLPMLTMKRLAKPAAPARAPRPIDPLLIEVSGL